MPDVITVLKDNVVITQVAGAELLLPMAIAASAVNADRAEAALAEIADFASGAPDAPSILNKINRDGSNVLVSQFRGAIGSFINKAAAQAKVYSGDAPSAIRLDCYDNVFDRGGALYGLVGAEPVHDAKLQLGSGEWYEFAEEQISPEQVGLKGSDDSLRLQRTFDAAEALGRAARLLPGETYHVRGSVYLGNLKLVTVGATIFVHIGDGFAQRGAAIRKNEAAILTKSAVGAGLGYDVVSLAFDDLNIQAVRETDSGSVKTAFLLENVEGLTGNSLTGHMTGTGNTEACAVDLYGGVQGLRISNFSNVVLNGAAPGGLWFRSRLPRDHADWRINNLRAVAQSNDETVAFYNSANAAYDLHDIWVGHIESVALDGGRGQGPSFFRNSGDYDPTKMRNISIGSITHTCGNIADGTVSNTAVKIEKCAIKIGSIRLRLYGTRPASLTSTFGVRAGLGTGQTELAYIGNIICEIIGAHSNPSGAAALAYGPMDVGFLGVHGSGTGWKAGAQLVRSIADGDIDAPGLGLALQQVDRAAGRVVGKMDGTSVFTGRHVLNTNENPGANWFVNASATSPREIRYTPESVEVTGAGAVGRVVVSQSDPAYPVPVTADYTIKNPNNLALSSDVISGRCYYSRYSAKAVNGAVTQDRSVSALTIGTGTPVALGAASPTLPRHTLSSAASLSFMSIAVDGQELELRAGSGTATIVNNAGSVPAGFYPIRSATGANVTLTDIGGLRLRANLAVGRWEVRQ